jgi:hypothetical protein
MKPRPNEKFPSPRAYAQALALAALVLLGAPLAGADSRIGRGLAEAPEVLQFFVDPTMADQGWILTEAGVQFNPGIKSGGGWSIKFDRETFRRASGETAGSAFRIRRIQPSRVKRGAVLLLVENGDSPDARKRYVFLSTDSGDTWKISQPTEKPEGKPTPSGADEASTPAARSAPQPKPVRVRMDRERPAGETPGAGPASMEQALEKSGVHPGGVSPLFNLLFDLWLDVRPGITPLTFDNYHTLILLDLRPTNDLEFSAEVSPTPRYYEITYHVTPSLDVRGGRIWIPFDEMNPHEIYGGFYNIDRLREPGSQAFLPEIWTDLGIAARYRLYNGPRLKIDGHAYVVNGFGDGGTNPVAPAIAYPNFDTAALVDNNTDKAVGLRLHGSWNDVVGLGLSGYEGRWTSNTTVDRRLVMLGVDIQLKFPTGTALKGGYIRMGVGLPHPEVGYNRQGSYIEASQKFLHRWKLTLRTGAEKDDSRVPTVGDRTLAGLELGYTWSYFGFSLLYYKDFYTVNGKANYEMTALRAVAIF